MTTHPYDDIDAFVLGDLSEGAADAVLRHADDCASCAVLLADAMRVASALETDDERRLSRGLHVRSLNIGAADRGRTTGMRAAVLGLSLVAAAFMLLWFVTLGRFKQAQSFDAPIALLVHSHFVHHALHGQGGNVKVLQALDGSWLYLVADNLTPNTPYVLSERTQGKRREVGRFQSNFSGQAAHYWQQQPMKIDSLQVADERGAQLLVWP